MEPRAMMTDIHQAIKRRRAQKATVIVAMSSATTSVRQLVQSICNVHMKHVLIPESNVSGNAFNNLSKLLQELQKTCQTESGRLCGLAMTKIQKRWSI